MGAGVAVPSVTSSPLPGASISQADLESFVASHVGAGAWGTPDTGEFGSQFYVLFLPPGVTVLLPSRKTTCGAGPYGYHRSVKVGTTYVPYAVVANCMKGKGVAGRHVALVRLGQDLRTERWRAPSHHHRRRRRARRDDVRARSVARRSELAVGGRGGQLTDALPRAGAELIGPPRRVAMNFLCRQIQTPLPCVLENERRVTA